MTYTKMRDETEAEHIARDMREGRFPERSEPQMVPVDATPTIEQLLPWAKLGMAVMQDWPEVVDIEGHWLQDVAEKAGVLIAVDGGFDPAIHHDPMGDAEAGDDWYQIIKRPVLDDFPDTPTMEIEDEATEELVMDTGFGLVTPAERARRYMGQIMAECDCPQEAAFEVAGACLSINQTCRKCGGEMEAGYATDQTFTAGSPDFPGSDRVTMSVGGPGRMIPCRKCKACGWSVTV